MKNPGQSLAKSRQKHPKNKNKTGEKSQNGYRARALKSPTETQKTRYGNAGSKRVAHGHEEEEEEETSDGEKGESAREREREHTHAGASFASHKHVNNKL
jgi:hypothetical protein